MREITITVRVSRYGQKKVQIPDEDYEKLFESGHASAIVSVRNAINDTYAEAENSDTVKHDYEILNTEDGIVVDWAD